MTPQPPMDTDGHGEESVFTLLKRSHHSVNSLRSPKDNSVNLLIWVHPRGYEFCQWGVLKNSGRSCRGDGNGATLGPVGVANQQVGFGRCSMMDLESLSVSVNEHRRKAPTWGPPRIPECMEAPDPFPPVCIT